MESLHLEQPRQIYAVLSIEYASFRHIMLHGTSRDFWWLFKQFRFLNKSDFESVCSCARRVDKLENALIRLEATVQAQAQDVVALATGFALTDDRVYVQNTTTATVHMARCGDEGRTICGWSFAKSRSRGPELPIRSIHCLNDLPGMLLCEKSLPTERAVGLSRFEADLSSDEL